MFELNTGYNMSCKKLEEFDKDNPNYQFLNDAIQDGSVRLNYDECAALIFPPGPQHITNNSELTSLLGNLRFGLGMKAYLEANGFTGYVVWLPES